MQRYFARIVRALIISSIGFGGGIGLMVFIAALVIKGDPHAFQFGLHAGLWIGGMFAVLLVGVLLPLDITAHLFHAKGRYNELWELEQAREMTFEGPLREAVSSCRKALLVVPYIKAVSEDLELMKIKASVGQSWRSGGESIDVDITDLGDDRWKMRCTSRCSKGPVLFDYGKNFDNVEAWFSEMQTRQAAVKSVS